jgi:hypothetical protein
MRKVNFRLRESMLGYAATREPRELLNTTHMGRSEAPLSRDPREETPGGANRQTLHRRVSKMPHGGDYTLWGDEKLRGVESKFNERDQCHSWQLNSDYSSFNLTQNSCLGVIVRS